MVADVLLHINVEASETPFWPEQLSNAAPYIPQ